MTARRGRISHAYTPHRRAPRITSLPQADGVQQRSRMKTLAAILFALFTLAAPVMGRAADDGALDLTQSGYGVAVLLIFIIAYAFVIAEEFLHLRKSKLVLVVAGLFWVVVGFGFVLFGVSRFVAARYFLADGPAGFLHLRGRGQPHHRAHHGGRGARGRRGTSALRRGVLHQHRGRRQRRRRLQSLRRHHHAHGLAERARLFLGLLSAVRPLLGDLAGAGVHHVLRRGEDTPRADDGAHRGQARRLPHRRPLLPHYRDGGGLPQLPALPARGRHDDGSRSTETLRLPPAPGGARGTGRNRSRATRHQ